MVDLMALDELVEDEDVRKLVSLSPNGKIGILCKRSGVNITDSIGKAVYNHWRRQMSGEHRNFPRKGYEKVKELKNMVLGHVEALATIGAITADLYQEGGRVFEIGCGVAIPSITYQKLSGGDAIAIDISEKEIQASRELAYNLSANLDLRCAKAEEVMKEFDLGPKDIMILSGPDGTLVNYWRQLVKERKLSTLILHGDFYNLDSAIEKQFNPKGYTVRVAETNVRSGIIPVLPLEAFCNRGNGSDVPRSCVIVATRDDSYDVGSQVEAAQPDSVSPSLSFKEALLYKLYNCSRLFEKYVSPALPR